MHLSEAIEEWLEIFTVTSKNLIKKVLILKSIFQDKNVTQAHARKIKNFL